MQVKTLYDHAPLIIQNLMVSAAGWEFRRVRYGTTFEQFNDVVLGNERLNCEELRRLQFIKTLAFIRHCYAHSPHYKQLFDSIGLSPADITESRHISQVPVTSKEMLRSSTSSFFTEKVTRKFQPAHTSGTTGSPLTIYYSSRDYAERFAFLERCRRWAGVSIAQRRASFTGRNIVPDKQRNGPYWRLNRPCNQLLLSAYHLLPANMGAYLERLKAFNPEVVDGYPSALHILAEYMLSERKVGDVHPRAVMTTAETLHQHQRMAIEQAFGCKVFNQYASSEGAPFISECDHGSMHVHIDSGLVEVVRPDGNKATSGEGGELVVTSFTTHMTPLLRFAIKDSATTIEGEACTCGRPFPLIGAINGRVDDILYTAERGFVGRMDTVFKTITGGIMESQIVQVAPDTIFLRLVPDRLSFNPQQVEMILSEMRKRLGHRVMIKVELLQQLPRGKSGKMRAVINECIGLLPKPFQYPDQAAAPQDIS